MTVPCGATVIVRATGEVDTRIPQKSMARGIWSLQVPHEPRPGQACNRKRPKDSYGLVNAAGLRGSEHGALSDHDDWIRLSITPLRGRGKGRSVFTHGTAGRTFAQSLGISVGVTISGGNIGLDGFCQIINQRDA